MSNNSHEDDEIEVKEVSEKKSDAAGSDSTESVENTSSVKVEPKAEKVEYKPRKDQYFSRGKESGRDWFDPSRVIYGFIFIGVGLYLLAVNLNIIPAWVNWSNVWRLWPGFIIIAGVSMLGRRNKYLGTLLALATIAVLVIAFLILQQENRNVTNIKTSKVEYRQEAGVNRALINLDFGAINLKASSQEGDELIDAKLDSNFSRFKSENSISDNKQTVNLAQDNFSDLFLGANFYNNLDLKIGRKISTDLVLDSGASDIDLDLRGVKLENMDLSVGASNLKIRLGDEVDSLKGEINAGASQVKLEVPKNVGVKIVLNDGLSSKNFDGFDKKDDKTYQTQNYPDASKLIELNLDIGASNFEVKRV